MASIWKLPTLFVCENNQFATEVPFEYSAGNPNVAERGAAYNLPSETVDGTDVPAESKAANQAILRARDGEGSTLLECRTYRTRPHAEGMGDFSYRTREEVEQWQTRCPIERLKQFLLEKSLASETELTAIEGEVSAAVEEAHRGAEASPWP